MASHVVDLYHYNAGWCEGPGCYVATCAEFQGLTAQGSTPELALATLRLAVKDIVEGLLENGEDVPEPLIAPDVTDREDAHGRRVSPPPDGTPFAGCT
jgi:predicted RNase H-like HicB family nuclease